MSTETTDVAPYEAPGGVEVMAANTSDHAVARLMQHAQAMKAARDLAEVLCDSDLVPDLYKKKAGNGAAAILYGAELGLNPIQSLQQIFVVYGVPAIYARTMVALVKSHGHAVWTEASSDTSVTVSAQRAGDEHVETSTWTIDRARKAGYTSNKKYDTDPQGMLYAKASTEVCRKIAPDILLGIAYSREELELEHSASSSTVVQEHRKGGRGNAAVRASLGIAPKDAPAASEPVAKEDTQQAAAPTTAAESDNNLATQDQLNRLGVLLDNEKLGTDAEKLDWINNTFHTDYKQPRDVTFEQALGAIEYLEDAQAQDAKK